MGAGVNGRRLQRLPGWELALEAALRHTQPFAWGRADCCLFAADVVRAMTGQDFAARWRGRYASAPGALRFVREAGGLQRLVEALLGPAKEPLLAHRGDLVLFCLTPHASHLTAALGICAGDALAAQGRDGVVFAPLSAGLASWRI